MVENFEIIFEGTSLLDCIEVRKYREKKTIVIDKKKGYGDYLSEKNCIIEKKPQLIRSSDGLVNYLVEMNIHLFIEFLVIKNHFYFTKNDIIKIPTSKNEISECTFLSNKEKFYFYKAIKNRNIEILKQNISKKSFSILCIGICGSLELDEKKLYRFLSDFEDYHFLYPIYGFKEICECISRCNAVNGISYLLQKDIKIENKCNKFTATSDYGIIEADKHICIDRRNNKNKYYRIINYAKIFKAETFYGVFDLYDKIFCICISSAAKICPGGTFLIYFWKYNSEITDKDLIEIGIDFSCILYETSFINDENFEYDLIIEQ